MIDFRCEQCGCSFSMPLGRTCDDHRPVPMDGWRHATADEVEWAVCLCRMGDDGEYQHDAVRLPGRRR